MTICDRGMEVKAYMQERSNYSVEQQSRPEVAPTPRRITEIQIDTTDPEIRRRLKSAYRELLKYRARRLQETTP